MAQKSMTADEKRWRAESDADTMARYEEIMADASRRKAAMSMARKRADELTKRANAMNRVASTKPKKK
jgi:hypothetical protein